MILFSRVSTKKREQKSPGNSVEEKAKREEDPEGMEDTKEKKT